MSKKWRCIEVVAPEQDAEILAFEVAEELGAGVEMTSEGFRTYVDAQAEEVSLIEATVKDLLAIHGKRYPDKAGHYSLRTYDVMDEDWADRWKAHFKPMRVGRRFVICPTWETFEPEESDSLILMDPGRAFGTGHHETTRLCIEWLEDFSRSHRLEAMSLLDLGTGSGILAMAAALLGFHRIVALDIDEEAVEVARENLSVNGLEARVHLEAGSLDGFSEQFDVVVANIQAGPLTAMAPLISEHVLPNGALALSGILSGQANGVRAAYEAEGLTQVDRRNEGEWCLLVFHREA